MRMVRGHGADSHASTSGQLDPGFQPGYTPTVQGSAKPMPLPGKTSTDTMPVPRSESWHSHLDVHLRDAYGCSKRSPKKRSIEKGIDD